MYASEGLQWVLLDGNGWVPDWKHHYTLHSVLGLSVLDLGGLAWLESFVGWVCKELVLANPFAESQAMDTDDLLTLPESVDTGNEGGSSDGSFDPQSFLRRVRCL